MRLHVEAVYLVDDRGRLVTVNDGAAAPAPRFFLGRTVEGTVLALRHDVPEQLASELADRAAALGPGLDTSAPATALRAFADVLSGHRPVERSWTGPNYRFPAHPGRAPATVPVTTANAGVLSPHLEEWLEDVSEDTPMAAVLEDGHAVSVCCSVRTSTRAAEAGVETHPNFRGRGLAAKAVAAWAQAVRRSGRTPLYSTSWENEASRRVAARLGLVQYGSVLHMT